MLPKIEDYEQFVGKVQIEKIKDIASRLEGKHIVHVNSTYSGGGVAEILNSLVVLINCVGVKTDWHLLMGSHSFFDVTKKIHNALQGEKVILSNRDKRIYLDELERNALMHHFHEHDLVFIHDPQPLGLIKFLDRKRQPWIWRCHIELKNSNKDVWTFLRPFLKGYDGAIFSMPKYKKRNLNMPQFFVAPSIDPLSLKNRHLSAGIAEKILAKESIGLDKPLITQVSRFDKWKNPLGVIRIFKQIREKVDARLVLIGDMASDDPEGPRIYSKVIKEAEKMKDVHILTKKDDLLVNALQRRSHVVLQNSIREGFGLTVSESLWKGTPVVATNVGGISLQVLHGKTGALVANNDEAAQWCVKLIRDGELRKRMGTEAREHVRKNFLITRQMLDYLNIVNGYTSTVADDIIGAAKYLKRLLRSPLHR